VLEIQSLSSPSNCRIFLSVLYNNIFKDILIFVGIYFLQTCLVRNELKNVLESKTATITQELNSSITNISIIDGASILTF